jgi:solute carrier family 24 (sodium/potassium/calcium exchanger), member 6
MGMVWIYFFANVIVDLLVLFGIMTDVSASMLGLTVLSWGNSVGDAIASISISKRGFGEMAMTGCVAGPVFNLLLGLGLTLLWTHSGS